MSRSSPSSQTEDKNHVTVYLPNRRQKPWETSWSPPFTSQTEDKNHWRRQGCHRLPPKQKTNTMGDVMVSTVHPPNRRQKPWEMSRSSPFTSQTEDKNHGRRHGLHRLPPKQKTKAMGDVMVSTVYLPNRRQKPWEMSWSPPFTSQTEGKETWETSWSPPFTSQTEGKETWETSWSPPFTSQTEDKSHGRCQGRHRLPPKQKTKAMGDVMVSTVYLPSRRQRNMGDVMVSTVYLPNRRQRNMGDVMVSTVYLPNRRPTKTWEMSRSLTFTSQTEGKTHGRRHGLSHGHRISGTSGQKTNLYQCQSKNSLKGHEIL